MWEYGISLDDYPCTSKVLEYFQNEVLPIYNIVVDEDNPVVGKGQYKAFIVSEAELREYIRVNKKKIKEILGDYSEYEPEETDDTPFAEFVLHSDTTLNHVHLFNAELRDWDSDTGEAIYDATL
jgi:hypothetical protein